MFHIGIVYPTLREPTVYLDSSDTPLIIMAIGIPKRHFFNVSMRLSSFPPVVVVLIGFQSLRIALGPTLLDLGSWQDDYGIHGVSIRRIHEEEVLRMEKETENNRKADSQI